MFMPITSTQFLYVPFYCVKSCGNKTSIIGCLNTAIYFNGKRVVLI